MIKNYLKVAIRNLLKNKVYVIVNLLGLGIALACCIVAYLNYAFNEEFNSTHENSDQIYRINTVTDRDGRRDSHAICPIPLGPAIAQEVPGITGMTRYSRYYTSVKHGDKVFQDNVFFAEADINEMFTFNLLKGHQSAFDDPSQIVLDDKMAAKLFEEEDPIGKPVSLRFREDLVRELIVGAVIEELPLNGSLECGMLADYDVWMEVWKNEPSDWSKWAYSAFIKVEDPQVAATIPSQMDRYIDIRNQADEDWNVVGFELDPLATMAKRSQETRNNFMFRGTLNPSAVFGPSLMAVFILLIACFNFINTSIAISGRRLKEIGLRKVLGGSRTQLVLQLMGENLLLCFLALWIGLGIAEFLVPAYSNMWPFLDISLDYSENIGLIGFLFGLLMLTGILGGAYPAFYVSKFEPVEIFKGKLKFGGTSLFSRILLMLQFSISISMVATGLIFAENAAFMEDADLGFETENVLTIFVENEQQYEIMYNHARQHPDVDLVAGTRSHIYHNIPFGTLETPGKKIDGDHYTVGYDYLEAMDLRLREGRTFSRDLATDRETVVLNQLAVDGLGLEKPLGAQVVLDSVSYTIIGVVENFYQGGFWSPMDEGWFVLGDASKYDKVVINAPADRLKGINDLLKKKWEESVLDIPYGRAFMQESISGEAAFISNSITQTSVFMSFAAILLSVIGLFALVSLDIVRRTKEIGVRKVFGATISHITRLIGRPIVIILVIGLVISLPYTYFITDLILDTIYDFHMPIGPGAFIVAGLIVIVAALITIASKVLEAANTNPAITLRDE